MLVQHRIDDVNERLVAVEEPVPSGEQVALEPALTHVLGQHLEHAPVPGQAFVRGKHPPPASVCPSPKRRLPGGWTRSHRDEEQEVVRVARDDVLEKRSERARRLCDLTAGLVDLEPVVAKVGQREIAKRRPPLA